MHSLVNFFAANNSLTGHLPAQWFTNANSFPKLMDIDLRWNEIHGPVPGLGKGRTLHPRVYVAPMDEGFGLCEESSTEEPDLFENDIPKDDDMFILDAWLAERGILEHSRITTLPSCPSGKPPFDMRKMLQYTRSEPHPSVETLWSKFPRLLQLMYYN
jgi:hypothetical protein